MTHPTPDQDAISTARNLTGALSGLTRQLAVINERQNAQDDLLAAQAKAQAAQAKYEKRTRIAALVVIGSEALNVIGTIIAIAAISVAIHASNRAAVAEANAVVSHQVAASQHAQLIAGCRASNELKARQETVWTFIEQFLGPKPGDSPAKRAASEQFLDALKQHVSQAYLARNCERAFPAPAPAATKAVGKP